MKTLTLFIQPSILEQIGFARIAKFLNGFQADLTVSCAALLSTINSAPLTNYFSDVAAFLAAPENLPVRLRQAMSTLETATAPQNEDQLDTLIKRHIPNVSLNRSCPLDCALELWFAAPESLYCFAGFSVLGSAGVPAGQPSSLNSEPRRLARILRPFGINSRTLRFDGRLAKGYLLADLPKAA